MVTKLEGGGGGKALVAGPLKKELYFLRLPLLMQLFSLQNRLWLSNTEILYSVLNSNNGIFSSLHFLQNLGLPKMSYWNGNGYCKLIVEKKIFKSVSSSIKLLIRIQVVDKMQSIKISV